MAELEGELDPTIWSNLPYDILLNVVVHSDLPTQINWSCTSRAMFPLASCEIWGSLCLRSSEITAYVLIVAGQRSTNRTNGIVHFLLESSYRRHDNWDHVLARNTTLKAFVHRPHGIEKYEDPRQLIATLPISRVKDLEIDNQGFDDQHPRCRHFNMNLVLPALLQRLLKLRSFHYLGPLSPKALVSIVQVSSLRALQLRTGNDVLKVPSDPNAIPTMPWEDVALDWIVLANLKGLQALEIGRLISGEGHRLAQGVATLDLRRLHLSCWGWESENSPPNPSMHCSGRTSALVLFLDALTTLDLRGDRTYRGLPSTLEHLVLIDKYHTSIPSLHQLIATAILPCKNLKTLGTTIKINGKGYNTISKMGLPAYHRIVGLNSWQQLSSDEGMKMLHQYLSPLAEIRQTNPYPRPVRNIFKTLDEVIAAADGLRFYRMSMKFVRDRQLQSDEIIVYPCEEDHGPSAAERGPQAHSASMEGLTTEFKSLSLNETFWAYILRSWGAWSEW